MFRANGGTAKFGAFQDDKIWRGPHSFEGGYVSSGVFKKNNIPSAFILSIMFENFFT